LKGAIRTSNQNAWQARLAADFGTRTNSFKKLGIGKIRHEIQRNLTDTPHKDKAKPSSCSPLQDHRLHGACASIWRLGKVKR
jgi:hypothetical protein